MDKNNSVPREVPNEVLQQPQRLQPDPFLSAEPSDMLESVLLKFRNVTVILIVAVRVERWPTLRTC
jgi:hypothetical protein